MSGTVLELILVLETYFPPDLPIINALCVLGTIAALCPILLLHRQQRTEPRQPMRTAWLRTTAQILMAAFGNSDLLEYLDEDEEQRFASFANDIAGDLDGMYELMGLETNPDNFLSSLSRFPMPGTEIIITSRQVCRFCPPTTRFRSLRREATPQPVHVLGKDFIWRRGMLFVAHCRSCQADYYPDRITFIGGNGRRIQQLEYDAAYLKISKHGIWCARRVAVAQENAIREFRAGWSNFANWINAMTPSDSPHITYRQSQRLFMEHFGRRLLVAHNHAETFTLPLNLRTTTFTRHIRDTIGKNGGVIKSAMHHGCMDCTHRKRYRSDLIDEGIVLDEMGHRVAEDALDNDGDQHYNGAADGMEEAMVGALPLAFPAIPPVQEAPLPGQPRGYVRMAVMDGKTIGHRVSTLGN